MDELVIGEKKYVSSKQASKITGYAKDYIGQLCREGRVPARLVGRAWYVLETAIQDHRFGKDTSGTNEPLPRAHSETAIAESPTWESPRYEPTEVETLPPINRIHTETDFPKESEGTLDTKDSWKSWFDHFTEETGLVVTESPSKAPEPAQVVAEVHHAQNTIEAENVPLHVVERRYPPRDLLPVSTHQEREHGQSVAKSAIKERRESTPLSLLRRSSLVLSVCVALFSLAIAVVGTGYFDRAIISLSQVQSISGITVYNK